MESEINVGYLGQLDLQSKIAYYIQLKEIIQKKIENLEYQPGEKLPSESELCQQMQVSRTVVRQTLTELEHEGLVYKRKGKGSFVAEPKINLTMALLQTDFIQDMHKDGKETRTRVLNKEVVPASQKIADYLKVNEGDKLLHFERLRYLNEEPILLINSYLPKSHCSALMRADLSQSLYTMLQQVCNIEIKYGDRLIEAVGANEKESHLFGVKSGTPMMLVVSISYMEDGTPIEYSSAVHCGDRSRLEIRVVHHKESYSNTLPDRDREFLFINAEE
ncbi:MAG: GntR family transcriptional regulator [Anaerolineaceae bacterium]